KIIGIGSYLPKKILNNFDLEKMIETSDEWITTRTGIKERRIAGTNEAASDLAYRASLETLKSAKVNPEEIDLIIVATISPDMFFPSTACILQEKIGAKNAFAFDINAACSGFIYALSIADVYLRNGNYRTALVVATEVISKFTDWQDRSTCVLFGDGAGAAVLKSTTDGKSDILSFHLSSKGKYSDLLKIPAGGSRLPSTVDTVQQRLHYIKNKGNEVFKIAVQSMIEAAEKALEKCNLTCKDIKLLIPHQANLRIINAIAKRLGLSEEKIFLNIHKYGNMSAATIAVGLDEAVKEGKIKRGDLVELVAFGAGFTSGACVIRW
ncbi:MAG TPA: 3-oxoacyl-ACP synthase, partial [Elusimicrobia bacterium]|nr:3-oxoacyl-ACP synthase [Elusimicrobiota bacterium]